MSRDSTQAGYQGNLETTVPNDFGQASVTDLGAFQLLTTGSTAVFEGAVKS